MEVKEFEGKNEEEAINKAIESLGLDRDDIDVEIVEAKKAPFLFGGGKVKIRVHLEEDREDSSGTLEPSGDFEKQIIEFVNGLIERIGISARVYISFRQDNKIGIDVDSSDSGILIGKRGQTLEALQTIVNVAASRIQDNHPRIIVDSQNYRSRRERSLIRLAYQTADEVRRTRDSRLLEAMNPFERRLIHTTLSKERDVDTTSEGEGLYKRVRVYYKGSRNRG
ncbi:MAG: protein jag [Spirochaetaceae bacterium]|nr:MAG: protein jag [Spirochaetaceae bacterium]